MKHPACLLPTDTRPRYRLPLCACSVSWLVDHQISRGLDRLSRRTVVPLESSQTLLQMSLVDTFKKSGLMRPPSANRGEADIPICPSR
jgi:hypothetical protein